MRVRMHRDRKLLEVVHEAPCMGSVDGCNVRPVQAAHSDDSQHGKCLSRKSHDCFIAAMCGPGYHGPGCHHAIGAGHRLNRAERRQVWTDSWHGTFALLYGMGLVVLPKLGLEEWVRLTGGLLWPAQESAHIVPLPGTVPDDVWLQLWLDKRARVA